MHYTKPAITYEQQLEDKLLGRGLIVPDRDRALRWLRNVGYYRLSAYFIPFRVRNSDEFKPGIKFDDVTNLYKFDAKLRLLVMQAVGRIEVAARAALTYHSAHRLGIFGYTDPANFQPFIPSPGPGIPSSGFDHKSFMDNLRHEANPAEVIFVRHYREKYAEEPHLPIWMVTELMTFGKLSSMIAASPKSLRKAMAKNFGVGISQSQFVSWLHCITYVRNLCAHHRRLWNRELSVKPELLAEWKVAGVSNERMYCVFLVLDELMQRIAPTSRWKDRLMAHIEEYKKDVYLPAMRFPENWINLDPWRVCILDRAIGK